ncbi:T9SS type A sorting domain-containing protein [Winogradskyella jejuensis]|uniref:Por secretion system C-terminal sorting domain-containing protein n=1 Tax=Winogradskyella jejuensis TaxID=1089305 RepID=A0A1M5MD27_9FLAO|nr:T9SS type A sorting domain-containing protein [Winogradskyella jejuensis]SHG75147.1 Por secretion system C-terminal sorting domain-containing protein [Winogradskyella jejuensis]
MKKITTLLFAMLTLLTYAQTTYDFEVERDATNSNLYTVFAVPSAAATGADFASGVVLFTIATGETIGNITSLTGTGWETDVDILTGPVLQGAGVGDGTKDVISLVSDVGQTIFNHGTERFGLVSFEVTSSPTGGDIEFVETTDPLITTLINDFSLSLGNVIVMDSQDGSGNIDRYGALVGDTNFNLVLSADDFILSKTSVFPNPIVDTFNIKTAGISIDNAQIYNINGALVKTISADVTDNSIDISELNSGIYFLQLVSGNANRTIKLIKQ